MNWVGFAIGSAFFAGLTAILGKLGVEGLNSNLATFIRTVVILFVVIAIITMRNEWQLPQHIAAKPVVFLVLSGVATGLSWLCYYRALQLAPASWVAPIDKLSGDCDCSWSGCFRRTYQYEINSRRRANFVGSPCFSPIILP